MPTLDQGTAAADVGLGSGATALVAFNDLLAIGILQRLRRRNVDVPGAISVVGHDDIFGADFCQPSLTTVHTDVEHAGRTLVDLVLGRILSRPDTPIVIPAHLVVRESTGPVVGASDSRRRAVAAREQSIWSFQVWSRVSSRSRAQVSSSLHGIPSSSGAKRPLRPDSPGSACTSDDLPRTIAAGVDVSEMQAVLRNNGLALVEIEFLGGWASNSGRNGGLSPDLAGYRSGRRRARGSPRQCRRVQRRRAAGHRGCTRRRGEGVARQRRSAR